MTDLTPRQAEVLRLLAAGHTNDQIARQLGIGQQTTKNHLTDLYIRLGVQDGDRSPRILAARYWWAGEQDQEEETA